MATGQTPTVPDFDMCTQLQSILCRVFGHDSFREGQLEASKAILLKKDVFVRMRTSGGKSLCYLLPALVLDVVCVVVSPLISLMDDQVGKLVEKGVSVARVASLSDNKLLNDICSRKYKIIYVSPEAITSCFWRKAMAGPLKSVVSFIAIDEAHLIEEWGSRFRPSYKELNFIRACLPSVPLMALSATAPVPLIASVTRELCMVDYELVSAPLNRPNLFYSLDLSTSIVSVFRSLSAMLSSVRCPEVIPKTLVFCRSKDTLYNVYVNLVQSCTETTRGTVGQYHATMTLEGRAKHYKEFKCGKQRVMVATSAFGLGVDIDDICEVILFGLPEKGSELAGRGGRYATRLCLVRLVARSLDLKDCEVEVGKLASRKFCLRKVILRDILRSDELLPPNDLCCSVCKAEERPRVFVTELESTSLLPCPGASSKTSSKNRPTTRTRARTRRVLAAQRSALRIELVKFRKTAGRSYYKTRGLDGVLSMAVIAKLVKQCNTVSSEEDVRKLGVVRDFSLAVLQLVEYHIPRTVATNVQSCGWDGTRTIPETATSDVLRDISNVP